MRAAGRRLGQAERSGRVVVARERYTLRSLLLTTFYWLVLALLAWSVVVMTESVIAAHNTRTLAIFLLTVIAAAGTGFATWRILRSLRLDGRLLGILAAIVTFFLLPYVVTVVVRLL